MRSFADFNAGELPLRESLPIFDRNTATEKYLDDKQVMEERSSCLSVYVFCSKLEKHVAEFNKIKHFRGNLINFLENDIIVFIENLHRDWPRDEYLSRLVTYINELKINLNIKSSIYKLEIICDTITSSLKEVDYDLSRFSFANKHWSGIYQLYSKYSDAIPISFNTPPEMYFVLFCYNPHYKTLREHIAAALDDLNTEHSRLTLTHLENFRYRLSESGGIYADKVVHITLIIAPLRTKDNNDEKHGKYLKRK
nr:hypothetical protein VW1E2_00057 [Enterobacter sp.]